MGQFLATGLVLNCSTEKENLQKYNVSIDELIDEMKKQIFFAPEIYDFLETDKSYKFKLKNDIFENQLLILLEKFYEVYYHKNKTSADIIAKLKNTTPDQWLRIAEAKSEYYFQLDEYSHGETVYFEKDFNPKARINSTEILLSIEGKVLTECWGEHANFFKYCIQQAFSEIPLAKALRVYITG